MIVIGLVVVLVALIAVSLLSPTPEPPPTLATVDTANLPHNVSQALQWARSKVLSEPTNGEAWGVFGMTLYAHQFLPAAQDCFAEAARLAPRDWRWPYFQGMILAERDPGSGIPHILHAAELAGDKPEIDMRLGEFYFAAGNLEASEKHFRRAEPHRKNVPRVLIGLARIAFQKADLQECLRLTLSAQETAPDRRDIQELLARTYHRLGETQLAAEAMSRAQALPESAFWSDSILAEAVVLRADPYFLSEQADALLAQGRIDEHLRMLDRLVQETPNDATSATRLARGLLYVRDLKTAARVLDDTLQRHPDAVEPMYLRAVVHFNQGEIARASELLNNVIKAKPDYVEAHYQLAACLRKAGRTALAEEELRTVLRQEPAFNPARIDLIEMLLESGDSQAAGELLKTAIQLEPANGRVKALMERVSNAEN